MAEAAVPQDAAPKPKRSKTALILGLIFALTLGGAGFYASYSGLIPGSLSPQSGSHGETTGTIPDIAFVTIEPMVLSLGRSGERQHLRFAAEIEVPKVHEAEVALLRPRILDVLNGYLRAVEMADLEDPAALVRLRAQMLRRVQIVAGEGRINDLLISEFVLN
jgi:flagellar FliL protein